MTNDFRGYVYPPGHPRLAGLDRFDARGYVAAVREFPVLDQALDAWTDEFEHTEFHGVTTDGVPRTGLFGHGGEESAPVAAAVHAARTLLNSLDDESRTTVGHPLDSKVWRAWMNPEIYLNPFGLRLEELEPDLRDLALGVLRASLSEAGYQRVRDLLDINAFLGGLVELPKILNEGSYNLNLFGTPSLTEPWGWNFYGHHVCLSCLFVGGRQVLTPVFFGAEPNVLESGTRLFGDQEDAALAFVRSLSREQAAEAILFHAKRDAAMPPGRLNPADELNLTGAFQDNRVIPNEGLRLSSASPAQREVLLDLVDLFLAYQPDGPRAARLTDVRRYLHETWFCWIGGTGDDDPFYFRVQSPVLIAELDHHAGVFLSNTEPEKFHTHTIVRTPNGNDYGAELVRQATGTSHLLDGPA